MRRKLTAILIADIVGYSRLMGIDEAGTHAAFKRHLKEHIQPAIHRHSGRLVKTLGDGVLVEFDSAVNAVLCACALQKGFAERNKPVAADRRLDFRIGVNLGDIMLDAKDVYGDGVNVADRLQALAEPGGIVVSQSIMQQVKGKVPVGFDDLGERTVKNIAEPVRIFCVTEPRAPKPVKREASVDSSTPVVAILPFVNMSGDPQQQYFSDGITEDIITELSRFRTICVIARNSSFRYRDKAIDVKQAGDELGAQFIVEGSVRKLEQQLRINVQLANAQSRHQIWADRFDVELGRLFEVQDEVTRRIVATVVPRIETEERQMARRQPTEHMRAYDCYLRGKAMMYEPRDAASLDAARNHFESAIAIDPQFAAAYAFLVRIHNIMAKHAPGSRDIPRWRERAWELANKAASLDDSDPHVHIALAWCHLRRREFDAAQQHVDIAARLNPNDADRAMDRGTTLVYLGQPEAAIELMQTAMRLNPFHPATYLFDLAEAYFVAHRHDDMIAIIERVEDFSPQFAAWKAAAYAYAGRDADARRQADIFVNSFRAIWAGDSTAGPGDYAAWLVETSPFRRQQDVDHLVGGLRLAGLEPRPRA